MAKDRDQTGADAEHQQHARATERCVDVQPVGHYAPEQCADRSRSRGDDPLSREYCLREIDISSAKRDLGYVPKVSLADGIVAYAERMGARRSA